MDYFSAMLGILMSLFYTLHRLGRIRLFSSLSVVILLLFLAFYLAHISYLTFYRFDYGYNMKANLVVGITYSLIWLTWSLKNYYSRRYAYKMTIFVVAISAAMSLELLDFSPFWRVLDAHSLWHAATIPLVRIHWEFLLDDALEESRKRNKLSD
jgi:hypothetical protein